MRLKSIKLAGFKSFVDPTTVAFPSNLCAVVGPNGCGKSNIIDAVRWVMGESSAKNLRGEHMTDVIFNGSANRKPVGQASVELVFDNSDHTITGEYASYNEISVRRTVTSDAQSTYYLNGTKCRRRDITDIFLGTGLGPRSYSIIEQGMVSRLIESKPEELRVFIEEAAGISKYKERRRETENRIKRTRENLERLTDIRDELERQLQHLQRQATAAEKYKELKQEERDATARLQALRWRDLDRAVRLGQEDITRFELQLESSNADQRRFDAEVEQKRSDNAEFNDHYHRIQQQFYSLGNDITRIEQSMEHHKQRRQQLEEDLRHTRESVSRAEEELAQDLEKIASLEDEAAMILPELEDAREQEILSVQAQEEAEEVMAGWQQSWDDFNSHSADAARTAEVEQQRIKHLENIVERGVQRRQNLEQESRSLASAPEEEDIAVLDEQLFEVAERQAQEEERLAAGLQQIEEERQRQKATQQQLNELRSALQRQQGRMASLEALQQAALNQGDGVQRWLADNDLQSQPRLVDDLRVEDGWELAVETVLGDYLQAVCLDGFEVIDSLLESFDEGELTLLDSGATTTNAVTSSLADRQLQRLITSQRGSALPVAGIHTADTLVEALSLRNSLQPGESIVTRDGVWLGQGWLRVARGFDEQAGMIKRQEEIDGLRTDIDTQKAQVEELSAQLDEAEQRVQQGEAEREQVQAEISAITRQAGDLRAERSAKMMKIEQVRERRQRLEQELGELKRQLGIEQGNIATARTALQEALEQMARDTDQRENLLRQRDEYRSALDLSRQKARHDRELAHQLSLRHQTLDAQLNSMRASLERIKSQVETQQARQQQLADSLQQLDAPEPEYRQELEEKLSLRLEVEAQLSESKARVDAIAHEMRELEKQRQQAQEHSQQVRDRLVSRRLEIEGATVRRAALEQSLREAEYDLETVVRLLPEELTESECQETLERLSVRIQRLGAINLAAIEEYASQSERKQYLDAQNADLEAALTTLENAIRKIDRETRTRFKETFDKVNAGLQELFPKVFGGGHAYLDMIGEDLLDTGVAIMARPPGKKNSTIHLLSGGEKAMTAIALVFSIFQLNPSPFCMLDEVDAPLDDANVGRYARLVKEMSDLVQFIFITHNRITMESANQLLGVTMHEPGVSRLVAVDVDEAAELAAM